MLIINLKTNLTKFFKLSLQKGGQFQERFCQQFNATLAMNIFSLYFFLLGKKLGTGANVSERSHFHLQCILVIILQKTELNHCHMKFSTSENWIEFLLLSIVLCHCSVFYMSTLWTVFDLYSKTSYFSQAVTLAPGKSNLLINILVKNGFFERLTHNPYLHFL